MSISGWGWLIVIRSSELLEDLNRRYARTALARRSYLDALAIFTALWRHARQIRPDLPEDWKTDVEADVELARVLNGVSCRP